MYRGLGSLGIAWKIRTYYNGGMPTIITDVHARELLDSRGNPTLAVTVATASGDGTFAVPSGASTGAHEALELRDGDAKRFDGKGVSKAVANVNGEIAAALKGMDAADQRAIDAKLLALDGTPNKSRLGGNALVGASIACAKAAAAAAQKPVFEYLRTLATIAPSRSVPYLGLNLINGGKHAAGKLAFQEYKVVPQTESIEEALIIGTAILHTLKKEIIASVGPTSANVGDEGGFAPDLDSVRKPLELFMLAAEKTGYTNKVKFAMDIAASSFWVDGAYEVDGKRISPAELETLIRGIIRDFPMLYIEDPFHEEAFDDFARLNADCGIVIVGDDLTVTNVERLKTAIEKKSISGIIIKPNQVGTLTETLYTMTLARNNGIECVVSHRSGETSDDFIADLAYAFGTFAIKTGAPQRGERVAKYNRLWEIAR